MSNLEIGSSQPYPDVLLTLGTCELAFVPSRHYLELFKEVDALKISRRISILSSCLGQFFGENAKALAYLANRLSKKTLQSGTYLFSEGDAVDSVYVIKEGELSLQKKVVANLSGRGASNDLMVDHAKTRLASLVQVGAGQYVGDFEVVRGHAARQLSALATTAQVKLYQIDRRVFARCLQLDRALAD